MKFSPQTVMQIDGHMSFRSGAKLIANNLVLTPPLIPNCHHCVKAFFRKSIQPRGNIVNSIMAQHGEG